MIANTVPSPNGERKHINIRQKIDEIIAEVNKVQTDNYLLKEDADGVLSLFIVLEGLELFVGYIGGGKTDQYVSTKPLGGLRFDSEATGFEHFMAYRDTAGDALGVIFGNHDSQEGNTFVTSDTGGLKVCQRTEFALTQDIGNQASVTYIEDTHFEWQVTSDQVAPYGALVFNFIGETDVDFTDVPFDVRIFDSTGTLVYSDIQDHDVWLLDPQPVGNPKFKLSSSAGVVNLPASQPFPMESSTTYTVKYDFATPVRLKGDGVLPALVMHSKRLEYYPLNYTGKVNFHTSDFTAHTNSEYKVDTSGGAVVVTVHPTTETFWIGDTDETWTDTDTVTCNTEFNTLVFGQGERKKRWQVIRIDGEYLVYTANGDKKTL